MTILKLAVWNGVYDIHPAQRPGLVLEIEEYLASGQDKLVQMHGMSGEEIFIRVSLIEGFWISTRETRLKAHELEKELEDEDPDNKPW